MFGLNIQAGAYTVESLADTLVKERLIDAQQRDEILRLAEVQRQHLRDSAGNRLGRRARSQITPAEIVASLHLTALDGRPLDEDRVMHTVARLAGLTCTKIDPLKLDHTLITQTLTRPFARRNSCVPLKKEAEKITFAVDNPFDQDLLHQLNQLSSGRVEFTVSAKRDILRVITEIYGFQHSVAAAERDMSTGSEINNLEQLVRLKKVDELEANDQHVVNAVEYLLHHAYSQRASDIHMEPLRTQGRVRLRIDGVLHEAFRVPIIVLKAMISRLKTLSRLDIAERRRPQDGRVKTALGDAETELRVSTMPVAFGEKLVLRIFDPGRLVSSLEDLGMTEPQQTVFETFLEHRHGMVLVTGPTGSGKTTSLYSALSHIARPDVNTVTIEDPIEMVVDTFNQVQVNRRVGLDFSNALRAVLRQDPDIVMVGEIRDPETAEMAVQAALTGHLVFSTLHTNSSAAAITRLLDLDVPPFLISSTMVGIVAQRLVRTVCDACAINTTLSRSQAEALEIKIPPGSEAALPVRMGKGCPRCRDTGLYGRAGIFELLPVNETIKQLIRDQADADTIDRAARADGMTSLREAAIHQLAAGLTSYDEVLRVLGQMG